MSDNKSPLEISGEKERANQLPRNTYNEQNEYSDRHPNAISDGDDKGKNELGSSTDIRTRIDNVKTNKFNLEKPYPNF